MNRKIIIITAFVLVILVAGLGSNTKRISEYFAAAKNTTGILTSRGSTETFFEEKVATTAAAILSIEGEHSSREEELTETVKVETSSIAEVTVPISTSKTAISVPAEKTQTSTVYITPAQTTSVQVFSAMEGDPAQTSDAWLYTDTDEIRQIVIDKLIELDRYNPSYILSGNEETSGEAWWGIGYFESGEAYAADFVNGKFSTNNKKVMSISCWITEGRIYLSYYGYFPK